MSGSNYNYTPAPLTAGGFGVNTGNLILAAPSQQVGNQSAFYPFSASPQAWETDPYSIYQPPNEQPGGTLTPTVAPASGPSTIFANLPKNAMMYGALGLTLWYVMSHAHKKRARR